jgi:hypothetical protein
MSDPLPRRRSDEMNAVERLALAMGRPVPRLLTDAEERDLEAKMILTSVVLRLTLLYGLSSARRGP